MLRHFMTVCAMVLLAAAAAQGAQPKPPARQPSGPGSAEYRHNTPVRNSYGTGDAQYWIFEPADPKPANAPVILFIHGWLAMEPESYRPWLEHLARRGNIVIYPRYQASVFTLPPDFTPNAIAAIKNALDELARDGHVKPDLTKVAAVGHSFGGVIAANITALAADEKLPVIKALLCFEPGSKDFGVYADFAKIPAKTLLVTVAAEADTVVGDRDAKRIFKEATAVAPADKNYILMHSDRRGSPPLIANHFITTLVPHEKSLGWYGPWKWLDGLTDAAFYGKNRVYALGGTAEQKFMGKWSDGTAVKEPTVTKEP